MLQQIPSSEQIQQAVSQVYTRPEFQPPKPSTWQPLWDLLGKALGWVFGRLDWLRGLRETNPIVFWLIMAWLVITLAALLAHIIWTAWRAARRGDDAAEADTSRAASGARRPRTAAEWDAEAARLAGEGRLREAAVALYQALLLRLDAAGAVRWDAAKTPGDYRREARRKNPEAATALGGFLRLFEPVAFGGRDLDREGWERLRAAAARGATHG